MCTASDRSIFDDREYESVLLDKNRCVLLWFRHVFTFFAQGSVVVRVGPQFTPNPLAKAATLSEARAKVREQMWCTFVDCCV